MISQERIKFEKGGEKKKTKIIANKDIEVNYGKFLTKFIGFFFRK